MPPSRTRWWPLPAQPGLIGYALRRELFGDELWTLSAWTSEDALDDFVGSEAHLEAMRAGRAGLREARFAQRVVPVASLPVPWKAALGWLEAE